MQMAVMMVISLKLLNMLGIQDWWQMKFIPTDQLMENLLNARKISSIKQKNTKYQDLRFYLTVHVKPYRKN